LLLGVRSPWQVRRVDLPLEANRVEVEVAHDTASAAACPECGRSCARYDHAPARQWRHLDVMQFTTIIRARAPRCQCPEHGVVTVQVPWAEPHGRFTLMFEAFAVTVIEAARSFVQAMEILKVDWHTIQEIVRRAVERGLLRRSTEAVKHVGMDEKSFGRGQDYVSLMTDRDDRRVLGWNGRPRRQQVPQRAAHRGPSRRCPGLRVRYRWQGDQGRYGGVLLGCERGAKRGDGQTGGLHEGLAQRFHTSECEIFGLGVGGRISIRVSSRGFAVAPAGRAPPQEPWNPGVGRASLRPAAGGQASDICPLPFHF
jgi:hypothetical protein